MTDPDIQARLAQLERMAGVGINPLGVDAEGWPEPVAPGELIESAWGNAVVDKLHHVDQRELATRTAADVNKGTSSADLLVVTVDCVAGQRYTVQAGAKIELTGGTGTSVVFETYIRKNGVKVVPELHAGTLAATTLPIVFPYMQIYATGTGPVTFSLYHAYIAQGGGLSIWYRSPTLRVITDGPVAPVVGIVDAPEPGEDWTRDDPAQGTTI